jgi:hypothetical protein
MCSNARHPLVALALVVLVGCAADPAVPDLIYEVTVESTVDDGALATDCVTEGAVYSGTFSYGVFTDAERIELTVDDEVFALGSRSGCSLSYTSAIWLDERPGGEVRWLLRGEADYEGTAGGCSLPDGVDWQGTETIEVVDSEDESIAIGCTYQLTTSGSLVSG